jgi:hypothetical protein
MNLEMMSLNAQIDHAEYRCQLSPSFVEETCGESRAAEDRNTSSTNRSGREFTQDRFIPSRTPHAIVTHTGRMPKIERTAGAFE